MRKRSKSFKSTNSYMTASTTRILRYKNKSKTNKLLFFLLIFIYIFFFIGNNFLLDKNMIDDKKGILFIGLDDDGQTDYKNSHMDSITYVGVNFNKRNAITLPIYRDTRIDVYGTNNTENINRIHSIYGLEIFIRSVEQFLGLPIDYYSFLIMDNIIRLVDVIGGIEINSSETFKSNYGKDDKEYKFIKGETRKLNGNETLAYLRYRGNSNGLNRANRQTEVLKQLKNKIKSPLAIMNLILNFSIYYDMYCNFSLYDINKYFKYVLLFPEIENLTVIQGQNKIFDDGWSEIIKEKDLIEKTNKIREEIFNMYIN